MNRLLPWTLALPAATRNGPVALGKGEGYALASNLRVADLRTQVAKLRAR